MSTSELFDRAIALWRNDRKKEAHELFGRIIYNNRRNEAAWIWFAYSAETTQDKIAAFEAFLKIFPQHALAGKALATLREEAGLPSVPRQPPPAAMAVRQQVVPQVQVAPVRAARPAASARARLVPWMILAGMCLLLLSASVFVSRYQALARQNENLAAHNRAISQNYLQLSEVYETLKSDHAQLNLQYNDLTGQYDALTGRFKKLNGDYSLLSQNYDSLFNEHNDLIQKYSSLSGEYDWLNQIAVKPPYIVVHDRMVDTTFYDTDGQLITWRTPFAGLEYDIEYGTQLRKLIVDDEWQTVLVSTQAGDPFLLRDFSLFVTPDVFENVVPPLYEKSSGSYDFIYRLWYMIGQLSHYAVEDVETPRYSLETLLAGGGDCEDLSILLASLIQAAPVDWYVDLVYVDSEHPLDPQGVDHVVVYIDTGQNTYLVETTSNEVMLPYTEGIVGWLAGDLQDGSSPVYLH